MTLCLLYVRNLLHQLTMPTTSTTPIDPLNIGLEVAKLFGYDRLPSSVKDHVKVWDVKLNLYLFTHQ